VLADELARCGLREVVVAPGSRSARSRWRSGARPGWPGAAARQARRASASFTALGLAKASRRPVAVVCHVGHGGGELPPGGHRGRRVRRPAARAHRDRPPELRGTGASQTSTRSSCTATPSAGTRRPACPSAARGWSALALARQPRLGASPPARSHPAGAVHLNIPLRDPLVPDAASPSPGGSVSSTGAPTASPAGVPVSSRPEPEPWPEPLEGRTDAGRGRGSAVRWWPSRTSCHGRSGALSSAVTVTTTPRPSRARGTGRMAGARRTLVWRPARSNALTGYQYLLESPEFMAAHRPEVIVSAGRPGLSRPQSALLRLARDVEPPARHVVVAQGPACGPIRQRAATDVAAAVLLAGATGPAGSRTSVSRAAGRAAQAAGAGSMTGAGLTRRRAAPRPRCCGRGCRGDRCRSQRSPASSSPRSLSMRCSGAGTHCPFGISTFSCRRERTRG